MISERSGGGGGDETVEKPSSELNMRWEPQNCKSFLLHKSGSVFEWMNLSEELDLTVGLQGVPSHS